MELLKLEQQRQALEDNLQKLRQSLKHWQLWEAEYEGLKEEIHDAGNDLATSDLSKIATTYGGDLVNENEVRELAGLDKDTPRPAQQIINLIERRQEYVQKNIETVQRQFFEAEAKQEEWAFAAATQGGASEAGLPLTEIHEELDDDGYVISSRLSQPEEATAKVIESLRKARVNESDLKEAPKPKSRPSAEDLKPAITNASPPITPSTSSGTFDKRATVDPPLASPTSDGSHDEADRPTIRKKSVSFTADTKTPTERPRSLSRDGKKSVSFNDKVSVMPAAPPPDTRSVSFSPQVEEIPAEPQETLLPNVPPMSVEDIEKARDSMRAAEEATGTREADGGAADEVILPSDEPPEDARLRQEMLDYHLNEVGNIVAHMDIDPDDMNIDDDDDTSSYHTTSEYQDDDDTPYTTGLSESEESEDELGRSKHRQVTPEYRKQMEELQQRLIGNLGAAPKDEEVAEADPDLDPKDVRKLVIRDKRNSTSSVSSENSEKQPGIKKRVSFAEELDVAEPGSPPLKAQKLWEGENVTPIAVKLSERTTAASHSIPQSDRPSHFKKTRAMPVTMSEDDPHAQSLGTASNVDPPSATTSNAPLRTTLLERPARNIAAAPSLDNPDTIAQRRELAEAYYSRRNDMIRQQGGFKADPDEVDEHGELMEETADGRVKKVSRFKAARLKGM
jgi:unconventional prefoldin RPB5 interactor 1